MLKYEARMVAKGFSQMYLLDHTETFAPVAPVSIFRILLAPGNQFALFVHHIRDVRSAFLNDSLKRNIFKCQ